MFDAHENRYLDFLCGAGSLNYGHNHPHLKAAALAYLQGNGILHSLDLHTEAKQRFLEALQGSILAPRGLAYKQQFTGPTGANAVEAALKLARKVTGRRPVVAFTNAYHGVSLGALAVTASASKRRAAGVELSEVIRLPYDGFADGDDAGLAEAMLTRAGSGVEAPAAIILETVQGEGGLQTASPQWLARIAELARRVGALLILDDIQTGCGRTGRFFSFEGLPIEPDLVCLSKSLSGLGLPLSVLLIAPRYDVWAPGEHNGTFRGNNLAFVSGLAALELWQDPVFLGRLAENVAQLEHGLAQIAGRFGLALKGRGMIRGLALGSGWAERAKLEAFRRRLVVETCGPDDAVLKLLPPLTSSAAELEEGLQILEASIAATRELAAATMSAAAGKASAAPERSHPGGLAALAGGYPTEEVRDS